MSLVSRRRLGVALIAALSLAACSREPAQPPPSENSAVAAPAQPATPAAPAAIALPACPPAPKLELSEEFGGGLAQMDRLKANFGKAYQGACEAGWLKKKPLVDPRAAHADRMLIISAPEANIVSIYLASEDVPASQRDMVLEAPFNDSEGAANVPTADELREAIYCYAVGATDKEQEESGRCLPD
jgi:hypothetical protein